jgi:photosystem II stability/assembly factor-like uncharacterized protein
VNTIQHFTTGQEFTVTSIHMIDANIGWAIGGLVNVGDHVLRTSDGGTTWTDLTPPEEVAASDDNKTATGYFQDAQTAWVLFSNTSGITPTKSIVWRTQDGGTTWQASQPLDLTNLAEYYLPGNLQFIDGQSGWLLVHIGAGMNHDYILLYRSQDGGESWSLIQDPYNDTSSIMSCTKTNMLFTDSSHGWLTGDCHGVAPWVLLYKSSDGGLTWERITLPDPTSAAGLFTDQLAACGSYDPFFFSNDQGHLGVNCAFYDHDPVTYQYFVYTTQDGGSTWTSSAYPGEALYFLTSDIGWAFSQKIQQTTDGGLTWKIVSNVSWSVISDVTMNAEVDFISDQIGWGIARGHDQAEQMALVKTTTGGTKWAMLVPTVGP